MAVAVEVVEWLLLYVVILLVHRLLIGSQHLVVQEVMVAIQLRERELQEQVVRD